MSLAIMQITSTESRGRPWRYSVIPSTPDFPTEYQIRRHSNPAGLPTFAAIWGPDFRASFIRLTCPHVFKQIKKYNYFDDDVKSQSSPTKLRRPMVIGMQRRGTRADRWSPEIVCCVFCAWLLGSYCVLWRCDSCLPKLIIAMKTAVNFPTELTLAGHRVWKTQPSQMTFWCLALGHS